MKNFLIVLLVLLLFALVIGVFASTGNMTLGNADETTVEGTAPSFTYSKTQPEKASTLLCSYDHGISDPSGNASSGFI